MARVSGCVVQEIISRRRGVVLTAENTYHYFPIFDIKHNSVIAFSMHMAAATWYSTH
jgi:hypothetical protein